VQGVIWGFLVAGWATLAVTPAGALGAPVASFVYSPDSPLTGDVVTFTSTSSGTISSQAWDLDGDRSCDDASGEAVQRSFAAAGTYSVTLCVTDGTGGSASQTQPVRVQNRAPVAAFNFAPGSPEVGESVLLTSFSGDPDGPLVSQAWDLDNDGAFDDAQGPSATVSFQAAGDHLVRLHVTDRDGATSLAQRAFGVAAPVVQFLSPFPTVRVVGNVRRGGTLIREIVVRAPAHARVEIHCRGGGCPRIKGNRDAVRVARTVRVRRFARRLLRPGAIVRISVIAPGTIGKYTRIRVRKGRPPSRADRCLPPGAPRPVLCPE
jgi:hypothetical protein